MHILAWRSIGYDHNGMELYFSNPDTKVRVEENPNQKVEDFTEAVRLATPRKPTDDDYVATNIEPMIVDIMNKYMIARGSRTPPKSKTIIVLTDGAWHGMQDEYAMDNALRGQLRALMNAHQDVAAREFLTRNGYAPTPQQLHAELISYLEWARPITLQFIQFGHDERGSVRLKRLDDDLKGSISDPKFP
jgi:hypothetical protein